MFAINLGDPGAACPDDRKFVVKNFLSSRLAAPGSPVLLFLGTTWNEFSARKPNVKLFHLGSSSLPRKQALDYCFFYVLFAVTADRKASKMSIFFTQLINFIGGKDPAYYTYPKNAVVAPNQGRGTE